MAARVPLDRSEISLPGMPERDVVDPFFQRAFRMHEHSGRVVATQMGGRDARKISIKHPLPSPLSSGVAARHRGRPGTSGPAEC